jgi:hypothetical protein
MTQAWLKQLTQREIVWLMVQLRKLSLNPTWTTPRTAEARIRLLRTELLRRGEEFSPVS